jgi:hypothetical protein
MGPTYLEGMYALKGLCPSLHGPGAPSLFGLAVHQRGDPKKEVGGVPSLGVKFSTLATAHLLGG